MGTKWVHNKWRKTDIEILRNVFRNFELNRVQDIIASDLEGILPNETRMEISTQQ